VHRRAVAIAFAWSLAAMLALPVAAHASGGSPPKPLPVRAAELDRTSARPIDGARRAEVAGRSARNLPVGARLLGHASAGGHVTVTVSFRPRNAELLRRFADAASARPGLSIDEVRQLFAPASEVTVSATRYLGRFGLTPIAGGILTRTYSGTVRAAERAFGVRLRTYAAGRVVFRSPNGPPTLPATLAAEVQSVSGLDTYPLLRPATAGTRHVHPHALSDCAEADAAQTTFPFAYQPADLAGASAYDFQSLLDAGSDGTGEELALVEFSNYDTTDVAHYQSCYGTSVPVTDMPVGGGTSAMFGSAEVELDEEVAITAAPGLDQVSAYIAPVTSTFSGVLDAILSDIGTTTNTSIVSISWGACEPAFGESDLTASDDEFQMLAAAGVSVFAASGDDGSSDCKSITGSKGLYADYPASDPYVTGVGGTTLHTASADPNREKAWGHPNTGSGGGGGGGVSRIFPMPSWQRKNKVAITSDSSHSACGQTTRYCREVPDVALDANPDSGYLIYCTTSQCLSAGWIPIGGTSAAAPLLAAMTADANEDSLSNAGGRLGFASPFFYANAATAGMFRDVTVGSNNIVGGTAYPAGTGYDMATGLGAPQGSVFATQLAGATAPTFSFDDTSISAGQSRSTITPGHGALLSGTLLDTSAGNTPLPRRRILVTGYFVYRGAQRPISAWTTTDASGHWQVSVTTDVVKSRLLWQAVFPGEENKTPDLSPVRALYVRPKLTIASTATWNGHAYVIQHGTPFTLSGTSNPNMAGKKVVVQYKPSGGSWHSTPLTATVSRNGTYKIRLVFNVKARESLRFAFNGSKAGQWLSTASRGKRFIAT